MTKQPKKKPAKGWDNKKTNPVKTKATTMAEENYYEGSKPAGLSECSVPQEAVEDGMSHSKTKKSDSPTVEKELVYERCPKCGADRAEFGFYGDGKFPGESERWTPFCKCGWTAPLDRQFAMAGP